MAFAQLLRSPHPHARIRAHRRLAGRRAPRRAGHPGGLASCRSRSASCPSARTSTRSASTRSASSAIRWPRSPPSTRRPPRRLSPLIDVDYEVLPRADVDRRGAGPRRTRASTTTARTATCTRRSPSTSATSRTGFAEADHVREDTFFFEGNTHLPMEQHAAVAVCGPGRQADALVVDPDPALRPPRRWPRCSRCAPAHMRVIACPNGGGFGGKSDPFGHEIVVCKLSMKTGRPVKITLTREEVFYCHRGRHPVKMWVKTGLKKDGTITAMHFRTALDGGALRQLRRRQPLLHGRAADGDLQDPALQVRGRARLHQQAALRAQARPRHAAAALRAGVPHRQVLPRPRPRSRATGGSQHASRRAPSPRTRCRCGRSACASAWSA